MCWKKIEGENTILLYLWLGKEKLYLGLSDVYKLFSNFIIQMKMINNKDRYVWFNGSSDTTYNG